MRAAWVCSVALAVGCYNPSPPAGAPCNSRGECPSGLACIDDVCQEPGALPADAAIDACPALTCEGNDLAGCGSKMTCALGCAPTATPHCKQLVPSNGIDVALLAGATANLVGRDYDFNTTDGTVTFDSGMPVRPAGTGVINGIGFTVIDKMGVFTVNSLVMPALVGSGDDWDTDGTNALVLFAATTITVAGRIDAGANGTNAGPGGSNGGTNAQVFGCRGQAGAWESTGIGEGGGGGGGRTAGGNGAPAAGSTFGAAGTTCTQPSTIPLRGGYGGGAGGWDATASVLKGGNGGGGGGGIALVAMESITIAGQVASPGEGGASPAAGDGGGGGGAGGAILIEAPVVTISGALTANGGGGGAPSGMAGQRGHLGDSGVATGGTFNTGAGGRGGAGTLSPGPGTTFTDATPSARGGGGGGAAGRTHIKARSRTTAGAVLSPAPTLEDIATQ